MQADFEGLNHEPTEKAKAIVAKFPLLKQILSLHPTYSFEFKELIEKHEYLLVFTK